MSGEESDYEYEPYSTVGDLSELYPYRPRPDEDWDYDSADTRLDDVEGADYDRQSGTVPDEHFGQTTFDEVYGRIKTAFDPIVLYDPKDWDDVGWAFNQARQVFQLALDGLEETDDAAWEGETYRALRRNLDDSIVELEKVKNVAPVMGILVEAFANTISTTKDSIAKEKSAYDNDLASFPEYRDEVENDYDDYARRVMQEVYQPNIVLIAKNTPVFTAGDLSEVGQDPGLGDENWPEGDGSGGFDGLGTPDGGLGTPDGLGLQAGEEIPDFGGATLPDPTDTMPALPTYPIANPSGLNNPSDAVRAASDAARNGLGAATDAAKQAVDSARKAFDSGLDGPPEGVLGLGPKGLGGSPDVGGGGGKPGAGAGARLPRSFADGRPTGAATTSATRLPSVAGAVTGAGPGMMGPPGAGAPTGAQRGGDNNNGHQVLKALRRKKNGQDVAGEANAVVPVLGAREKPARPNADQTDKTDPPGTEVRPVPRGAHRPEHAMQVQNP